MQPPRDSLFPNPWQGAQLTLRLREEPSQESMSQIYGTTRAVCQPPSGHPPAFTQVSCWSQEIVGNKNLANPVNQLQMNIPPMQPNISVTIPLDPSAHCTQFNVVSCLVPAQCGELGLVPAQRGELGLVPAQRGEFGLVPAQRGELSCASSAW